MIPLWTVDTGVLQLAPASVVGIW